jgi:hypothetical protein
VAGSAEYPQTVQFTPPRDLHPIERAALEAAIAPYLGRWPALAEQLEHARVKACQSTGVGSYTELVIPPSIGPVCDISGTAVQLYLLRKNNAELSGNNLIHGATTVGYIKGGYLSCLEIAAYADRWNGDLSGVSIVRD